MPAHKKRHYKSINVRPLGAVQRQIYSGDFVTMSGSNRNEFYKTIAANWRPLCVITVGIMLTVYFAWRLQPDKPDLPNYQPTIASSNNYQAGGSQCSPKAIAAISDEGKRTAKRDDCAYQAEDYRLKSDDLIQQTRAADAAQSQARSAYEQGWLNLWATLGGLWTLIAAGLAAAYARDAAKEGRRSADAAHASMESYQNSEGGDVVPEIEWTWAEIVLRARNIGKSSAQIIYADAVILPFDKDVKHNIGLKLSENYLPQNLSIKSDGIFPFPEFPQPQGGIYTIAGGIIYRDIFGRLKLCPIGIDIIPDAQRSHSSIQIDFGQWHKALDDLKKGKHVLPS